MYIRAGKKYSQDVYLQDVVGTDREGNEVRIEDKIAEMIFLSLIQFSANANHVTSEKSLEIKAIRVCDMQNADSLFQLNLFERGHTITCDKGDFAPHMSSRGIIKRLGKIKKYQFSVWLFSSCLSDFEEGHQFF